MDIPPVVEEYTDQVESTDTKVTVASVGIMIERLNTIINGMRQIKDVLEEIRDK